MNTQPTAHSRTRRAHPRRQDGFTLVEILVVISIIGVLVALLVPAISSAVRTANDAAVSGEIQTLAQSLASFKNKYGEYPPSRIMLSENGTFDIADATPIGATDLTRGQLAQRSLRYLRKFFPQAAFSSTPSASTTLVYDFNGNGNFDGVYILDGTQCLVFFLGGIPTHSAGGVGMSGFAKSPINPFQTEAVTTNRNAPFFEFKNDRLIVNPTNGFPSYVDSLGAGTDARAYAYFSAYAGGGYDPNDINFNEPDDESGMTAIARYYRAGGSGGAGVASAAGRIIFSPAPNPYTTSLPVPEATGTTPMVPINRDSYQLFSAGRDRLYGFGGRYDSQADNDRLPLGPADIGGVQLYAPNRNGIRDRERDNIANFSTGRLE